MKGLAFAVAASLLCVLATSASAAVVRPDNKSTSPPLVQDYLSNLNPTISVIEASQVPVATKGKKASKASVKEAVAALSSPLLASTEKTSSAMSAFLVPTTGRGTKHNAVSDPPSDPPLSDPLAATPEPAGVSLMLFGLFATGFLFARRSLVRPS